MIRLKGKSARLRPNAASAPREVANSAVIEPINREFQIAIRHSGEVKKSSYQRSENDGIG